MIIHAEKQPFHKVEKVTTLMAFHRPLRLPAPSQVVLRRGKKFYGLQSTAPEFYLMLKAGRDIERQSVTPQLQGQCECREKPGLEFGGSRDAAGST